MMKTCQMCGVFKLATVFFFWEFSGMKRPCNSDPWPFTCGVIKLACSMGIWDMNLEWYNHVQ